MKVWIVLLALLVEYGLSYADAEEVLDEYARTHVEWIIKGELTAEWSTCSLELRRNFWKTMKAIAFTWVKKNRPGHWAQRELAKI